jgi:hypothetical protein
MILFLSIHLGINKNIGINNLSNIPGIEYFSQFIGESKETMVLSTLPGIGCNRKLRR